jgi:hypothetical protein
MIFTILTDSVRRHAAETRDSVLTR